MIFISLTGIHMNKSLYHCRIRDKLLKKERTLIVQLCINVMVIHSLGNPCKIAAFKKEKLQA